MRGNYNTFNNNTLSGAGRGMRSAVLGAFTGTRPVSYYPPHPSMGAEDSPLSYHKMGASPRYGYQQSTPPSGYRSNLYGAPLTPRGGPMAMSMQSPTARMPVMNKRFMEPIDGYIYQVCYLYSGITLHGMNIS